MPLYRLLWLVLRPPGVQMAIWSVLTPCHSRHPRLEPLTQAESSLDVTYVYPQSATEAAPLTPAVPEPLGAALPLAVVGVATTGGLNGHLERSDPLSLPSPRLEPLTQAESSLDVTYVYPQSATEAAPLTPAVPEPLGAALSLAVAGVATTGGPNGHLERSDPPSLPSPRLEPLTRAETLLDVTYIHPQATPEVELLTPALPSVDVAGLGATAGPLPGRLVARSDPLSLP